MRSGLAEGATELMEKNTLARPPRGLPHGLPRSVSLIVGMQASSGQEPGQARDRADG